MKKLMILGVALAAFTFSAPAAFADNYGGEGKGKGHKGKMFKEADANADGVISKDEFKAHHEKKADDWFTKLDADGNGEVTDEEAKEGRKNMRKKMKDRKGKRKERKQERGAEVSE